MPDNFLPAVATLVLAATLPSQVTPHERALPKSLTGAWGNGLAVYDPVRDGTRTHQAWFRGDNLPKPYLITAVGERSDQQGSSAMSYRLTVILDNSKLVWAQLGAVRSKNLSAKAAKVFDATINLKAITSGVSPNQAHQWVKLTRPWVFTGPNLVVEKTWTPPASASGKRRHDAFNAQGHQSRVAGKTCGGNLKGSYTSPSYSVAIDSAPANVIALFLLSIENVRLGTIRLPIDLTAAGFKGCELGVVPMIVLPGRTDASGNATLTFPFPQPADSVFWSVQGMHQTTTNPGGWATTNVVNTVLGATGLCRNVRFDKRGTKGPDAWNATGPVLLLRGR